MTEYSRMAKGLFTSTGAAQIINLPFQPDYVEMVNVTAATTPAQNGVPFATWDASDGQGTAIAQYFNATPVLSSGAVTSGGISTFSAGLLFQFGATYQHTGSTDFSISKASPAVVTTTSAHGLKSGDVVIFQDLYQTSTTGMPQIDGIPFTVTVTSSTQFSIPWNTNQSNYTAFDSSTSTNNVGSFKQVLYPYLYAPGVSIITGITTGTTTTIDTTDAHNFVVGQEVAIRMPTVAGVTPAAWGDSRYNSLPNSTIPGSPIYAYVIAVTDYNTVVLNINSTGYTAYNSNIPVANVSGLQYPQIVAVGDVNTGGVQISSGSALYPPPFIRPIGTTTVNTINGPAIQGAFFNNTSQGFIIGSGALTGLASTVLVGATGNVIRWRAFLHDMSVS
jgi:hypothetical protein